MLAFAKVFWKMGQAKNFLSPAYTNEITPFLFFLLVDFLQDKK